MAEPDITTTAHRPSLALIGSQPEHASPHGRRYSPAEKESAYTVWKALARSLAKTSTTMGIARATLTDWHRDGAWASRADQEDQEAGDVFRDAYWTVLSGQVLPSILTAVEIRDNETVQPKDRLAAAQWLAGVAGLVPVKVPTAPPAPARSTAIDYSKMTDEELFCQRR